MKHKDKKSLWNDSDSINMPIGLHKFLCGQDIQLDKHLMEYDIKATSAHVFGLQHIGVLSRSEYQQLNAALKKLSGLWEKKQFTLDPELEDCHSAIELWLQKELGSLGQKVHTGRSRNDQVLTALRLYMKDHLTTLSARVKTIALGVLDLAEREEKSAMPGHTHMQKAMPTTVAVWLGGFAEAMCDDLGFIQYIRNHIDTSPLGTAAGFGVPLNLPREKVAEHMGLSRVQINPVYAQNSRGKFELLALQGLYQIMLNVKRLSWDLSLFSTQEFAYMTLDKTHSTGSSIMPNKNNPDVVELMRASCSLIEADMTQIQSLLSLPSGYHRDLQFSKSAVIRSFSIAEQVLKLLPNVLDGIQFNHSTMINNIDVEMMQTDLAIQTALSGSSFREAYHDVKTAKNIRKQMSWKQSLTQRVSLGAAANPGLGIIRERILNTIACNEK